MKIGLLGGTFNPIHNGHLALADEARIKFGLDEVWFIPAGDPYQKSKEDLLPANIRYNLVGDAIGSIEWAVVCSIEVLNKGPSYTCETLAKIKALYPDNEFFLIVGADAFKQINISWRSPQYIFDNCTIIVAYRADQSEPSFTHQIAVEYQTKYDAKVLEMPFYNQLSSSWIREKSRTGSSYRFDVPYNVYKYINTYKPWKENKNGQV
jgi:nicotinate-nucleotide adenylyltransferase